MKTRTPQTPKLSEHDRLLARPTGELPTPLDPASPAARGYPADPKPSAPESQGNPQASEPAQNDTRRKA